MSTILFYWSLVGFACYGKDCWSHQSRYEWKPMAEFASPADCQRAAKQLSLEDKRYICIAKGTTK